MANRGSPLSKKKRSWSWLAELCQVDRNLHAQTHTAVHTAHTKWNSSTTQCIPPSVTAASCWFVRLACELAQVAKWSCTDTPASSAQSSLMLPMISPISRSWWAQSLDAKHCFCIYWGSPCFFGLFFFLHLNGLTSHEINKYLCSGTDASNGFKRIYSVWIIGSACRCPRGWLRTVAGELCLCPWCWKRLRHTSFMWRHGFIDVFKWSLLWP